jgi:putative spermidine/putrescine transport system permease protein
MRRRSKRSGARSTDPSRRALIGVSGTVRRRRLAALLLLLPAGLLIAGLLAGPLLYLLSFSLHHGVPGRIAVASGLTLANYLRILTDPYYLAVMGRTLALALGATTICLLLGFPLAYFLWRAPPRWKGVLILLVVAPLLISIVVRSYSWMVILGDTGVLNDALQALGLADQPIEIMFTATAVLIGLVHVQFPFMVLSILAGLERIDPDLIDAAATLGAPRGRAILEIVLPLSVPGIVAGVSLVFSLCMTAFVTPTLMGGSGSRVLTTLIYNQFVTVFDWPTGAAIAALLLLLSLGVAYAIMRAATGAVRRAEA